jgi:hypothetical protein
MEKPTMAELVELNTLSCTAKGFAKQYDRAIELDDVADMAADAGFSQYVVTGRSGAKCGQNLISRDFPYQGNIEVMAYNAAKRE